MAVELVMPRLSESMEEGTVVSWLVADGAQVAYGQEIAEIETDKATVPYEAPETGILRILVPEGSTLALGQPIGLIDDLAPLPGGQSVAPPGIGHPGTGQVPAPRAPDDEPPTASFEIQPELHEPHTVRASSPPPQQSPDAAWSPAWGTQPAIRASRTNAEQESHEEEGETTEFAAISLEDEPRPPAPPPELPLEHADADRAAVLAESADATGPGPTPAATPAPPSVETPPAMPWVDPSFSPRPAPVGDAAAVAAGATVEPAPEPIDDAQRFRADELVGPATLPPRPPELRATPAAGQARVAASPVARRLAAQLGIDLATIDGTGPEGRVVRADIETAQATGAARPPKQAGATPAVASEFTPPVDDDRAAAPIPPVEPSEPNDAGAGAATPDRELESEDLDLGDAEASIATADALEAAIETEEAPDPSVDDETAPADPTGLSPHLEAVPDPTPDASQDPTPADDAMTVEDLPVESDLPPEEPVVPAPTTAEASPEAAAAPPTPDAAAVPGALPGAQPGGGKGEPTVLELTRQQQTVARRMAESKATIPDFHTVMEVDATPMILLRTELRTNRPDLAAPSVNDLVIKATAVALRAFPALNGAYRDGRLEQYPRVNVGFAVDASGTLLVPVVQDADRLSVSQIAERTSELIEKAGDGGLRPADIASATFTVSNLGTYGVDQFTAVITPGQAAILTVGAITARPVVKDGQVVAGETLRLTLTTDHRAIYGVAAASFLARVRQLLEHPTSLLA